MAGEVLYLAIGVGAIAIMAVLLLAIRLSYRIEARSPGLANRSGFPRNAMLFHTITNLNVARDEETQALRRQMIELLLIVVVGAVLMVVVVASIRGMQP
jgi:hypothetical protein